MIAASIRACQDMIGGNGPFANCGAVVYPVPHAVGQNYNGSSAFTDPIYVWANTGTFQPFFSKMDFNGNGWGNPCSLTYTDFWQSGRDYIWSGGDGKGSTGKAGYTEYTYPHPLAVDDAVPLRGRSTPQLFL